MESMLQNNYIYELKFKLGIQALRIFNIYILMLDPNIKEDNTVEIPIEIYDKLYRQSDKSHLQPYSMIKPIEQLKTMRLFDKCEYTSRLIEKHLYLTEKKRYIELKAFNRDLPYIIDYKKMYMKYELWKGLELYGKYQLHMYELIKSHYNEKVIEISVKNIRQLLNLGNYYTTRDIVRMIERWNYSLKADTDIHYIYRDGRVLSNHRILSMRFFIYDNILFKPNEYIKSLIVM